MPIDSVEQRRAARCLSSAKYRAAHRDKVLAYLKAYRAAHLEQELARNKAYKAAHRTPPVRVRRTPEERRLYNRAYHAAHKATIHARKQQHRLTHGAKLRAQYSAWARANKSLRAASVTKRRAVTLRALPKWADTDAIKSVYQDAARLTAETGVQHDVDHVYPLQSTKVCGLHVAANLQVLTHIENVRKGNALPVGGIR